MWETSGFKLSGEMYHFLIFKVKSGQHEKSSDCAVIAQPGIGSAEGDGYCWGFLVQLQETGTSFSKRRQFKATVTGRSVGTAVMMVFSHSWKKKDESFIVHIWDEKRYLLTQKVVHDFKPLIVITILTFHLYNSKKSNSASCLTP